MFHKPFQKFCSEVINHLSLCIYNTAQAHTNQQQAPHTLHLWPLVLQASKSYCSSISYVTNHVAPHLSQQALPISAGAWGDFGPVPRWVWLVWGKPLQTCRTSSDCLCVDDYAKCAWFRSLQFVKIVIQGGERIHRKLIKCLSWAVLEVLIYIY